MLKRKVVCFFTILALGITGCSSFGSNNADSSDADEYQAVMPYNTSDTRVKHVGLISDQNTRVQIEDGLMDLSKQYFSPNQVKYKTHAFLDYDTLDATDGSRGLLGTLRDDNPNGLNPGSEEEFNTGNGKVKGAILLADIYELDWYKGKDLKGISIALVVNGTVGEHNTKVKKAKMRNYLKVTSTKLVNYMRSRYNEITDSIPIYVASYQLSESEDDNLGGYIYSLYLNKNDQDFENLSEYWYRVPSNEIAKKDPTLSDQFLAYQNKVAKVLADNTYCIAQAKYDGDTLEKLNITITAHGKTAGEMLAVSQVAKKQLSKFKSVDCEYSVKVIDNEETYCMMKRNKNETVVNSVTSF